MCWRWDNIDWGATAAWVQAILSFLGIVVSGYIAAKVVTLPVLIARAERLAALSSMVDVARKVLVAARQLDRSSATEFDMERFDRVIEALQSVPLFEVQPGVMVEGLIELQENLRGARKHIAEVRTMVGLKESRRPQFFDGAVTGAEDLLSAVVMASTEAERARRNWWRP